MRGKRCVVVYSWQLWQDICGLLHSFSWMSRTQSALIQDCNRGTTRPRHMQECLRWLDAKTPSTLYCQIFFILYLFTLCREGKVRQRVISCSTVNRFPLSDNLISEAPAGLIVLWVQLCFLQSRFFTFLSIYLFIVC